MQSLNLQHVYRNGSCAHCAPTNPPHMKLLTVCLADLSCFLQQLRNWNIHPKHDVYSTWFILIVLCLLLKIFMADAMLWKHNTHTALSVISRHVPFCFLSLILAASATKWLDCLGLKRITTLQSLLCLFFILAGSVYVLDSFSTKGVNMP